MNGIGEGMRHTMMGKTFVALLAVAALVVPTLAAAQPGPAGRKVRVLVLQPEAKTAKSKPVADAVAGLIPVELAPVTSFDVLSTADVQQMIELEAEKAAMGCADNSCLAELAGALGADLVVYGDVSQLGALFIVNINLFDSIRTRAVGRKSIQTKEVEELPSKLSESLRSLVVPYLEEQGLDVPADWEDTTTTAAATPDTPSPAEETVAVVSPSGTTVGGVDGGAEAGGGFAVLPWSVAGGGAVLALLGVAAVGAGVATAVLIVPGAVEEGAAAAREGRRGDYDSAYMTYLIGYAALYGGVAAGVVFLLGGGGLVAGGAGWAVLGGE
jgi:hypothetical protein